jgi:hypothetical protein
VLVLGVLLGWHSVGTTHPAAAADPPLLGMSVRTSTLEARFLRQRTEQEPVSARMLDSNVTGMQSTVTATRLRVIPDPTAIRFELINSGDVHSQTTGIHPQALIETTGNHHFEIIKPMWFDGERFLTNRSHGTIQAATTPNRVQSAAGARMPLLQPLGDRVAWNQVLRRQPLIDRAAAEQVSADVLPKVDRIIEENFQQAARDWDRSRRELNQVFGQPLRWSASSTEQALMVTAAPVATSTSSSQLVAGDIAKSLQLAEGDDVVLSLSESAVAAVIARHFPGGRRLTDARLQELQTLLQSAVEQPLNVGELLQSLEQMRQSEGTPATLFTVELAKPDPVAVRFVGGDVRVTVRFQVHPRLGASSGWMAANFHLHGQSISPEVWAVALSSADVGEAPDDSGRVGLPQSVDRSRAVRSSKRPTDEAADGTPELVIPGTSLSGQAPANDSNDVTTVQAGTAWNTIVSAAVQSLAGRMPPVKLPREMETAGLIPEGPRVRLRSIESDRGVLRCSLRLVDRTSVAAQVP